MKKIIVPGTIPTGDFHQFLLGAVAPRPIAFVSTMDTNGAVNLAPYSFFNAFSSNPPILVFSSNRRVENNTTKDTLHNVMATKECVVNVVNYEIARKMLVCSVDFPPEINEFEQSGLTPIPATQVSAPLVKECPVNMECRVIEIKTLGVKGGAGHLIICEVLCMHIDESVLDDNNRIDPHKIDLIGRMGRAFYVRASGAAVHFMPQSQTLPIVGYPGLPEHIRRSDILSANFIGYMSGLKALPTKEQARQFLENPEHSIPADLLQKSSKEIERHCLQLFNEGKAELAVQILFME
ncbi:MAG: flavin reductase family protein [Bacteroidota bacterium]|nr:flavin reductase family protein [Bacteroidota bacterium]